MGSAAMASGENGFDIEKVQVRQYRPGDQPAVSRLYTEGLLAGQIAPNDTGVDIENIQQAYIEDPNSNLWVADYNRAVLGMVAVAGDEDHTAEIRRLRVDRNFQHTPISVLLVETALSFCKHNGYLKIVLDTRFEQDQALDLFDRFGFQHHRTRSSHGKDNLEFYLDLYRQPKPENPSESQVNNGR